jgi:hypothetical protein
MVYLRAHGYKDPPTAEELENLARNQRHILMRKMEAHNRLEEEKRNRGKCKPKKKKVLGSAEVNAEHLKRNMPEMLARIKADNERINKRLHPE